MEISLSDFNVAVADFRSAVALSGLSPEERYGAFCNFDPFSSIPPALLNAGHIATYALTAGMIEPFNIGELTKPATYLVSAEGPCRYRNENGHVERFYLTSDGSKRNSESDVRDFIRLAPNSICFVTLAPTFRMPAYIAARFNLLIRDVYRGLLVGTGPLVDPGFSGKLSIPIYNFTSRDYFINAGEGLVYFEFTKLSWTNPEQVATYSWLPSPLGVQPPFPASKNSRRTLDDYLTLATGGGPPQSAIGAEVARLKSYANDAKYLLGAYTLGGIAAAVGLFLTGWSVYAAAQQYVASAQTELRDSRYYLADEVQQLKAQVEEYKRKVAGIELSLQTPSSPTANPPPASP